MREAIIILLVIAVLVGLTAIRYRKQIKGMIGLARTLKELKEGAKLNGPAKKTNSSVALVNCARCGVWIPQDRALRLKNQTYCSRVCQKTPVDRKSTRLNSSHLVISYAVFCLKKKKK